MSVSLQPDTFLRLSALVLNSKFAFLFIAVLLFGLECSLIAQSPTV